MKYFRIPLVLLMVVALTSIGTSLVAAQQSTALERGYRTGYSDGYNAGFRDVSEQAARDFQNKEEYQRADRSYNEAWGPLEDYRDGYQQGFEKGYSASYDRQPFDSNLPTGFRKRGTTVQTTTTAGTTVGTPADNTDNTNSSVPATPTGAATVAIPRETTLVLQLLTALSTDATQAGDRFQARVIQPGEYGTAIVDGHVSQVKRPGKAKGVAQMQLSFDQIRFADNRSASLHAQLIEIVPMGRNDDSDVDREGGVRGRDSTKDDVAKVGAATGIGAIIGVIAGGGKGAAIGAAIGGGVGTAGVMSQRGKDIRLEQGQQLKIRTTTDTSL
jgi:hypothetical protein